MKKFISFFLFFAFTFWSFEIFAQEAPKYILNPIPIHIGEKSPIDGVLLTTQEVAEIVAQKKFAEEQKKIELEKERRVAEATLKFREDLLQNQRQLDRERFAAEISARDKKIDDLESSAKAKNYIFGIAVGVLVAGFGTILIVKR